MGRKLSLFPIENTVSEHATKAFHAIITTSNPSANSDILLCDEITDTNPRIIVSNSISTQRNAHAISAALRGIMLHANQIVIIDPYLSFSEAVCFNVFRQLLADVCRRASMPTYMHFCLSDRKYDANNTALLKSDFSRYLQRSITKPVQIKFSVFPQDQMHDRFILSDIASMSVGHGFTEGRDLSQPLNILMVGKQHHSTLWQQYIAHPPCLVI